MSSLSRDELRAIAELARITLTESEIDRFSDQLSVILDSVAKVQEVVSVDTEPMSHTIGMTNVFRPDEIGKSLTAEQALSGAPARQDDRFKVPRILEEE